jgi:hypothetical protein
LLVPLRQVVGLCLGAVAVVALVAIQFWFWEPTPLEKAERDLDVGARETPKVFEQPEYRLPPDAVARSLRVLGLPVEDRAIFPDAFSNAGPLVAAMLGVARAHSYRCDTIASAETIIDPDRTSTNNLWLNCNRGEFRYSFTRLGSGSWSFVKVLH